MQLTERAKQLIPHARIVSFSTWKNSHAETIIAIFQKADDEGRYLTDQDVATLKNLSPHLASSLNQAQILRDKAADIIAQARHQVIEKFPEITEPDGGLYPPPRAEACWRDFWHFLRCITYGIAGENEQFTSQKGLENMELLYQELQVPLAAMLWGLERLKISGLQLFSSEEQTQLSPYFDHLIQALQQFQSA
ncbi:MAG: phycobilisome protein [Cyanobacteria bacterium P01_G01_bin.49]